MLLFIYLSILIYFRLCYVFFKLLIKLSSHSNSFSISVLFLSISHSLLDTLYLVPLSTIS